MYSFSKVEDTLDKWERELIDQYKAKNKVFDVFKASKSAIQHCLDLSFYDFEDLVALQPAAVAATFFQLRSRSTRRWK